MTLAKSSLIVVRAAKDFTTWSQSSAGYSFKKGTYMKSRTQYVQDFRLAKAMTVSNFLAHHSYLLEQGKVELIAVNMIEGSNVTDGIKSLMAK